MSLCVVWTLNVAGVNLVMFIAHCITSDIADPYMIQANFKGAIYKQLHFIYILAKILARQNYFQKLNFNMEPFFGP